MGSKGFLARLAFCLFAIVIFNSEAFAQTAVTWQSQVNVTVSGTTISKTSGGNGSFDASALTAEQLAAGAGGVFQFTTTANTSSILWVGLSNDAAANNFSTASHVFYFPGGASVEIRELGTYKTETTFVAGDVFSFDVSSSGAVLYKKNGSTVYTSASTASLPLKLDISLAGTGASITNATYAASLPPPSGGTWTVCTANCDFTNSQLQNAFNAIATSTGPKVILLEEGHLYNDDYILTVKGDASATNTVTVRTGVDANGVLQASTRYPADNIRICPSTYTDPIDSLKDCAGKPGSTDMSRLAKIKPITNNAYGISLTQTGSGTPVSYWNFRWIEFMANGYGGNSIIGLNNAIAPVLTGTTAMIPHHFTFDQIVLRGDPVSGQLRGLEINASYVSVTNSFFYDIKALQEGQAVWANTSTGGINLINNYFSGGTEVLITGGGGTIIRPQYTVQSGATTTSIPLDRITDLYVGKDIIFRVNPASIASNTQANPSVFTTSAPHGLSTGDQIVLSGATCSPTLSVANPMSPNANANQWFAWTVNVLSTTTFTLQFPSSLSQMDCSTTAGAGGTYYIREHGQITGIAGNTITISPALSVAPVAGVLVDSAVVIGSDAPSVVKYNWFTHPAADRTTSIQAAPTSPVATPLAGGTLAAGTYYYKVQAQRLVAQGLYASSDATSQVSATVLANGSVKIDWTAAANAVRYVVYGRGNGAITQSWTVNAPTVTFTDDGSAGTAATAVASTTNWLLKNVYEMKQGMNFTIEYNLIENSWTAGQAGPCVLFTASPQTNESPSHVNRNITFRKNVIRNCAQFLQVSGSDNLNQESGHSGNFSFTDNLWYNADGATYGVNSGIIVSALGGAARQHPNRAPYDLVFKRNTFHSPNNNFSRALLMDMCDFTTADSRESPANGFQWVDNIAYSGVSNAAVSSSNNGVPNCNGGNIVRRWGTSPNGPIGTGSSITNNVFAGDSNCAGYPANVQNLFCPSVATLEADTFTNTTSITGFGVKPTSPYFTASTTGSQLGVDVALLSPITTITITGNNSTATVPSNRRRIRRDELPQFNFAFPFK